MSPSAFIAAGVDLVRAFSSGRAGPVAGYVLLSVLSVAAGVVALAWPGITASSSITIQSLGGIRRGDHPLTPC